MTTTLTWRDIAACADADPDLFDLPAATGVAAPGRTRDTAAPVIDAYCHPCPVRAACAAWAASEPGFDGIAGGAVWRDGRRL